MESDLLPFVFDKKWYNGEEDIFDGFTDDKYLYTVGMPRLRQLRTKKGTSARLGLQIAIVILRRTPFFLCCEAKIVFIFTEIPHSSS